MSILFEYGEKASIANRTELEQMLRSIWKERRAVDTDEEAPEEIGKNYQPFLQFDGNQVRANNYVGFIQDGDDVIEIYPKVFGRIPGIKENTGLMLRHIFYWFDYCRK